MSNAAIQAVYTDYKRVKGRKVHQVVFEVPSEKWPEVYKVLGEPDIETSQWFGIAAMNVTEKAETPEDQGKNYTANAAMMVKEESFRRFLGSCYSEDYVMTPVEADKDVKARLNIKSKSELNTDNAAAERWKGLRSQYDAWMAAA